MTADEMFAAAQIRLAYWQERLRLQDWQIKLDIVRMHVLDAGTLGDIDVGSGLKRQARIRLLHPDDLAGQGFWFDGECWNWEITLVHELLHIHFHDCLEPGWMQDRRLHAAVERAVDSISKALVPQCATAP